MYAITRKKLEPKPETIMTIRGALTIVALVGSSFLLSSCKNVYEPDLTEAQEVRGDPTVAYQVLGPGAPWLPPVDAGRPPESEPPNPPEKYPVCPETPESCGCVATEMGWIC